MQHVKVCGGCDLIADFHFVNLLVKLALKLNLEEGHAVALTSPKTEQRGSRSSQCHLLQILCEETDLSRATVLTILLEGFELQRKLLLVHDLGKCARGGI